MSFPGRAVYVRGGSAVVVSSRIPEEYEMAEPSRASFIHQPSRRLPWLREILYCMYYTPLVGQNFGRIALRRWSPFLKLLARLQAVQIPQYIFFHTFTSNESFFRRNDEEKEKN